MFCKQGFLGVEKACIKAFLVMILSIFAKSI